MKSLFKTIIVFILASNLYASKMFEDFRIMTEVYPPYNMMNDDKFEGVSVDILEEMLKRTGSKLRKENFELLPWAKAYTILQEDKKSILFSMFRTKQREDLFKWVGPIHTQMVGLIAKRQRNIKIQKVSDLNNYKIASVKDDAAELMLKDLGIKNFNSIKGTNALQKAVAKLKRNRVDLFAYMGNISQWAYQLNNFSPHEYELVYILKKQDLYYALNKDVDDKLVEVLQEKLDEIKKDGFYNKILNSYSLK